MPDFTRRSAEPELMDRADISYEEFHDCLRGLERINHLTLAYRPTLAWLKPWLYSSEPLTILDAGSGGGDMLRQIARRIPAQRTEAVSLVGVDLNPWSKKAAECSTPFQNTRFVTADIFQFEPERPVDIVISSLFTHHLSDTQLVDFLRWIDRRAQTGWFINDLHRHPVPYHFIKLATGLFSRNRLIRNDAAVSVARAFSVQDWRRLLDEAGIGARVRVEWYFPFRLCLSCTKA